jgi:hypothetical protein
MGKDKMINCTLENMKSDDDDGDDWLEICKKTMSKVIWIFLPIFGKTFFVMFFK